MKNNPELLNELKEKVENTFSNIIEKAIDQLSRKDNKELIDKYPWLKIRNVWSNYEFTWLDDLPVGWRKAFGDQLIEELDQILRKVNYQDKYEIVQIKEKWGFLHWYDNGVPENIYNEYNEWLSKYEELSKHTCIVCGKPGKLINSGWIIPLCKDCEESK